MPMSKTIISSLTISFLSWNIWDYLWIDPMDDRMKDSKKSPHISVLITHHWNSTNEELWRTMNGWFSTWPNLSFMIKVVTYTPIKNFDERMTFVCWSMNAFFMTSNGVIWSSVFNLFYSEKLWENDFVLGVKIVGHLHFLHLRLDPFNSLFLFSAWPFPFVAFLYKPKNLRPIKRCPKSLPFPP
jgi:hypothetical protein